MKRKNKKTTPSRTAKTAVDVMDREEEILEKPEEVVTDRIQVYRSLLDELEQRKNQIAKDMEKELAEETLKRLEEQRKATEEKNNEVIREAEKIAESKAVSVWDRPGKKIKTKDGKVMCTIISKGTWYENQKINPDGLFLDECQWGYYGDKRPYLIENEGKLTPYEHCDVVGESPSRLYKGANPEGWRGTWTHRSKWMQKVKIGLMVAVVLGIFFLIFILISQKPPDEVYSILGVLNAG